MLIAIARAPSYPNAITALRHIASPQMGTNITMVSIMGAYHSTKNSGVNFRKFPWASMGEWYRIFRLTAPEWKTISPFHSQFCPKKLKMGDSPEFLFAFEIFSDSEFIIDELMVEDDDIIVLSAISRCYMRRNLNRIYNFSHGNYRAVLFAGWIQEPFSYDKRNVWAIRTGSHEDGKDTPR